MNSNDNSITTGSPSDKPAEKPSLSLAVRSILACWRFIWSRRMIWTVAILSSLMVLFYQYENWHGARELRAVREKVFARCGTDNFLDLIPEEIPDAQNFWAIDEIKSWRASSPSKYAAGGFVTKWPAEKIWPAELLPFTNTDEWDKPKLDLAAWEKRRGEDGHPLPPGKAAVTAVLEMLGDGGGVIPRLAVGLQRPSSQSIPCRRSILEAAHFVPSNAQIPEHSGVFQMAQGLVLRLHLLGLKGDAKQVTELIGILTRLANGMSHDPYLVGILCAQGLNPILLNELNFTLASHFLTVTHYRQIEQYLEGINDVALTERMFLSTALAIDRNYGVFEHKEAYAKDWPFQAGQYDFLEGLYRKIATIGPSGWMDCSAAFAETTWLSFAGEGGGETWRTGDAATLSVFQTLSERCVWFTSGKFRIPNFRNFFFSQAIPALSSLWEVAAKNLFHRRCAILTCALHRFHLDHGQLPATLAQLDSSSPIASQTDPAKIDSVINYRRTDRGFMLWSVGRDRKDDEGNPERDWLWQHDFRE